MPYVGYKGDKTAARPPGGSLVETRSVKASSLSLFLLQSHAPDRIPERLWVVLREERALCIPA